MLRRGVALEMCNLVSWDMSQKWLATLFATFSTASPSGFGRVTLQQPISADKAMWTILARESAQVKPLNSGARPLDAAITKLICDPRVTMHMLALPLNSTAKFAVDERPSSSTVPPQSQQDEVQPKNKDCVSFVCMDLI